MKQIPLPSGRLALVDDDDYKELSRWKWRTIYSSTRKPYAGRIGALVGEPSYVMMHRLIMNAPKGMEVDHLNYDGLDNRKSNLEVVTKSMNRQRSRCRPHSSRFKGVSRSPKSNKKHPWTAKTKLNRKYVHIGCFFTEEDAARAYDKTVLRLFGPGARTNFVGGVRREDGEN